MGSDGTKGTALVLSPEVASDSLLGVSMKAGLGR